MKPDEAAKMMELVRDPRYSQEKLMKGLAPAASLKQALLARRLVGHLNKVYGWHLPEDGNWTVKQSNDVMYEIVLAPRYDQDSFLKAIKLGRRP